MCSAFSVPCSTNSGLYITRFHQPVHGFSASCQIGICKLSSEACTNPNSSRLRTSHSGPAATTKNRRFFTQRQISAVARPGMIEKKLKPKNFLARTCAKACGTKFSTGNSRWAVSSEDIASLRQFSPRWNILLYTLPVLSKPEVEIEFAYSC